MGSVDLIGSCLDSIRQMSDKISGAILYIDTGTLEAFQFIGAFPLLLELGISSVCSLENISSLDAVADWSSNFVDPATKKIVFIISRFLMESHRYILRCLGTHNIISQCTVFTSISEISHSAYIDSPLGPDAFHEYETLLSQDYEELLKNPKNSNQNKNSDPNAETTTAILSVSVRHFPMVICPISPRVFVLPSQGSISELHLSSEGDESISLGLPSISTGQSQSQTFEGDDAPPGVILTAHFLYYLADKMDLKLEIFSLGDTSKTLGKIMMDMSSLYDVGRRSKKPAGLLLIDRTLDLLTPCSHGDSFLDRLLSSIPRQQNTRNYKNTQNLAKIINRAPLSMEISQPFEDKVGNNKSLGENIKAFASGWKSGSEVDYNYEIATDLNVQISGSLESVLDRGFKDGIMVIKKILSETLKCENLPYSSDLRASIRALSKDQKTLLRNKGILKLALAADMANSEPHGSRWDAFVSAEKILSVSSGDTSQSLSSEIRDFISTSVTSQGILSLKDALLLSIIGYILAGENFPSSLSTSPFSWEEERSLKDSVIDAILEDPLNANFRLLHGLERELESKSKNLEKGDNNLGENSTEFDDFDDQWGDWGEEEEESKNEEYGEVQLKLELRDRVDQLFKFFHKLSGLRMRGPTLREGLIALNRFESDNYSIRKGFLYKILRAVLSKFDLPAIEYHSSAVGRFFKSGFGRFGLGQAKPNFGDQSVLFIFVVGGINNLEVREVMEAISESGRPDVELIIGGTTLLTPDDMFELMLG